MVARSAAVSAQVASFLDLGAQVDDDEDEEEEEDEIGKEFHSSLRGFCE